MPILTASIFSTEASGTTSTGVILANALGFVATAWDVRNEGTVPFYLSLNSTVATTNDIRVPAGERFEVRAASSRFGVLTTSTSTDGADHRIARVRAVGE